MKKTALLIFIVVTTFSLNAQVERPLWEFGGGVRLNYLGLSGGYEGERFSDGYQFKLDYEEIGMDNCSAREPIKCMAQIPIPIVVAPIPPSPSDMELLVSFCCC